MRIIALLNNDVHCADALAAIIPMLKNHNVRIVLSRYVGRIDGHVANQLSEKSEPLICEDSSSLKMVRNGDWRQLFGFGVKIYDDINSIDAVSDIAEFLPDLIISIRFGQILQQPLINIPEFGVLNLHSGILPAYRGIMPTFWAILNGENEIGMTLHYINNAKIDAGEIIGWTKNQVDFKASLFSNINDLYEGGCSLLSQTMKKIFNGEKVQTFKPSGSGSYFSYPKEDDVKRFLRMMKVV